MLYVDQVNGNMLFKSQFRADIALPGPDVVTKTKHLGFNTSITIIANDKEYHFVAFFSPDKAFKLIESIIVEKKMLFEYPPPLVLPPVAVESPFPQKVVPPRKAENDGASVVPVSVMARLRLRQIPAPLATERPPAQQTMDQQNELFNSIRQQTIRQQQMRLLAAVKREALNEDAAIARIIASFLVPWSSDPTPAEQQYRSFGFIRTTASVFPLQMLEDFCSGDLSRGLQAAFEAPHSAAAGARLTVGARALCKHYERRTMETHPFWKQPTGPEAKKNAIAKAHLDDLMAVFGSTDELVCWKNIHNIHPNNTTIIEVRNTENYYGMRWTVVFDSKEDLDGPYRLEFRGFLEPTA
ncbi:hypothetical protein HDU98_010181 [Podochytrium sp. JEL0797]|nr:hypothetical protein HDU98_010181 [Podochytrium sp. JEL0797]